MDQQPTIRVLIVEDDPDVASLMDTDMRGAAAKRNQQIAVVHARDLQEAVAFADRVDLIFADLYMPGSDPKDVVRGLRSKHRHAPILVVSGCDDDDAAWAAGGDGANDFLLKPVSPAQRRLSMFCSLGKAAEAKKRRSKWKSELTEFINDRIDEGED